MTTFIVTVRAEDNFEFSDTFEAYDIVHARDYVNVVYGDCRLVSIKPLAAHVADEHAAEARRYALFGGDDADLY